MATRRPEALAVAAPSPAGRLPVLADLPAATGSGALVREVLLVLAGTAAVTLVAQISLPLPGTPVPLTLGTFGVLAVGAALGPRRGAASVGLYVALAALGAPVLAGWSVGTALTASFGYVVGYLPAAVVLGAAARRGADRSVVRAALAAALGSLLVYAVGVPWLMAATGMDLRAALLAGAVPFLLGDSLKVAALALLYPAAWAARTR